MRVRGACASEGHVTIDETTPADEGGQPRAEADEAEIENPQPPRKLRDVVLGLLAAVADGGALFGAAAISAGWGLRVVVGVLVAQISLRISPLSADDDTLRWHGGRDVVRTVMRGALVGGLIGGTTLAIGVYLFGGDDGSWPFFISGDREELSRALISVAFAAPLVEEFVYRGLVFGRLRRALGFRESAVISSVLFWASHWIASGAVTSPHQLAAGLILAWACERSRSLLAPTILHALGNAALLGSDALRVALAQS